MSESEPVAPQLGTCESAFSSQPHIKCYSCVNWRPVEQASVSPPKWSEMMAEQHTCPLCDRTFTNAMELYRDEERAIDLVAKAASGGSAGGGVSSIPSDYNRAYQFMHTWLLKRNPKYANHKLTVRMRRNRLAELLCEYAAIPQPVGPEGKAGDTICQTCGLPNPCWLIESRYWNLVVEERVGVLCLRCFAERAASLGITGCWRLTPDAETNSLIIGETPIQRRVAGEHDPCRNAQLATTIAVEISETQLTSFSRSPKMFARMVEIIVRHLGGQRVDAQGPESAPAQEIGENCYACGRTIRPTMGPGDYSCVSCGFGMVEPCEHWKASIARGEVGNSDNAGSAGEPTEAGKGDTMKISRELAGVLRKAGEEVDAWPEWKRSLDPLGKKVTEAGKPAEPNDWPKALPGESLEFTKFWESTNNGPWFSVHPITQVTLRQVASEAYQAGAHAPTTPEGEK